MAQRVAGIVNRVRRHRRDLRQRFDDWLHPPGVCPRCDLLVTACICCGYCGGSIEHHARTDCPVELGIFPVDLPMVTHDIECIDCGTRFMVGEFYGWAADRDDPDVCTIVCLGCIARSELGLNRG